jgi:hypothetical protein
MRGGNSSFVRGRNTDARTFLSAGESAHAAYAQSRYTAAHFMR